MRNFKKFLSLVLAALMVTGMMVFTAPAASAAEYEATGDYAESVTLLNTLEVMLGDGESFKEDEKVTRWQMALFIARIVTGEVGNEMWEADKSQIFTDVAANHYPGAIDFCAELGIINGIGDGKFNPDGNITYQDALTMFVRLLGYEKSTTTYPWGYILTAVKLETENGLLTDGIDTKYTNDLLRGEVAQLLVNALYAFQAKTDGTQGTSTLMMTGLKAVELGTYKIEATEIASINGTLAGAGKVTFVKYDEKGAVVDTKTISTANVTKEDLDLVNYLGATATLITIKNKVYATMDKYTVVDNFGGDAFTLPTKEVEVDDPEDDGDKKIKINVPNGKIKVGKVTYATVTYGTDMKNVFVPTTGYDATNGKCDVNLFGRVYIFDINGDGKTENDVARFIPFNEAHAVYFATVAVKKDKGWPADGNVTLYYEPKSGAQAKQDEKIKFLNNSKGATSEDAFGDDKLSGKSVTRTSLDGSKWITSTSLRVLLDGKFRTGDVILGGFNRVGEYTFLTIAEKLEIVSGTAKLAGLTEDAVKLGETEFKVGFDKLAANDNGWYVNFAGIDQATVALLNKDVDYVTVNGQVVSIAAKGTAPTTTTKANPYSKDVFVLNLVDAKKVVLNADGTISVLAFNAEGELVTIKIDQINGTKVGSLINQFGLATATTIVGAPAGSTLAEVVKYLVTGTANVARDGVYYLVAVTNKAEDVYSISVADKDIAAVKRAEVKPTTLAFTNYKTSALSSKYEVGSWKDNKWNYAAKYLTVTADSKIMVFGSNNAATYTGIVPANGDKVVVSATAKVLALSSDFIMVFDSANALADIVKLTGASTSTTVDFKGGYYMLTWKTDYTSIDVTTENNVPVFHYTFENMYNLTTRAYESVVLSSKTYYTEPETAFFPDHWVADENPADVTAAKASKTLSLYDLWYISNDVAAETECVAASNLIEWAVANKYQIGRLAKGSMVSEDPNTLIIDAYTINEDGKTATNKNDDAENARNVSVVVSYSGLLFNQSTGSGSDEIRVFDHMINVTTNNNGYIKKATETKKEWIAYKITDEGVADIIVNIADSLT